MTFEQLLNQCSQEHTDEEIAKILNLSNEQFRELDDGGLEGENKLMELTLKYAYDTGYQQAVQDNTAPIPYADGAD